MAFCELFMSYPTYSRISEEFQCRIAVTIYLGEDCDFMMDKIDAKGQAWNK
jgi:hypothetical protein